MASSGRNIPFIPLDDSEGEHQHPRIVETTRTTAVASAAAPPPSLAPKLTLALPPLKKSRGALSVTEEPNLDLEDAAHKRQEDTIALATANTSGPLIPPGSEQILGQPSDPTPLMNMLNQWAERLEGTLTTSLGRKIDSIQANQQVVLQTVDSHTAQISLLHSGLDDVRERMQQIEGGNRDTNRSEMEHVKTLQNDLQMLADKVEDLSSSNRRGPPAPPRWT